MEQRTLLVVEDQATLREVLAENLRAEGYTVYTAGDGIAALEIARREPIALIVLDLILPLMDGLEVCRQLRSRPRTAQIAILMLTAKGEEMDKVVGLEMGADDYVTKPYSWSELRARIRALLRRDERASYFTNEGAAGEGRVLVAGDLRIDLDHHEVTRAGREIQLSVLLFDLLAYLVRNRGTVLTRDRLLLHVWATSTPGTRARWVRTCAGCASASRTTRPTRSSSSRCAAWATASRARATYARTIASPLTRRAVRHAPRSTSSPHSRLRI